MYVYMYMYSITTCINMVVGGSTECPVYGGVLNFCGVLIDVS